MYQPYPGSAQMPETRRPPVPPSVRNAVRTMYAGAAASLIGIVVALATLSTTKSAIERRFPDITAAQVNAQQGALIASSIVGGLVGAALWIVIARACRNGRNWARITGTIFFAIATVQVLGTLVTPEGAPVKIYDGLIWLIGLTAVVLLWQRNSSAFFAGTKS